MSGICEWVESSRAAATDPPIRQTEWQTNNLEGNSPTGLNGGRRGYRGTTYVWPASCLFASLV